MQKRDLILFRIFAISAKIHFYEKLHMLRNSRFYSRLNI